MEIIREAFDNVCKLFLFFHNKVNNVFRRFVNFMVSKNPTTRFIRGGLTFQLKRELHVVLFPSKNQVYVAQFSKYQRCPRKTWNCVLVMSFRTYASAINRQEAENLLKMWEKS